MTLSVVIPAFNEEDTVGQVVRRVLEDVPFELEIIAIDDGSTDRTGAILDRAAAEDGRVRVIHQANAGKAAALRNAFSVSRGGVVVVQDADLEYDPGEIVHLVQPIFFGQADVVFGSRFLVRRGARVLYFHHYIANRVLTLLSNVLTNLNMTDVETGYKAFRGDIVRNMIIESRGFGIEIELTAKVAKLGVAIYEVPISYYGRTYEEGKKIGFVDGLLAIWYLLRFNLLCSLRRSFRSIPHRAPVQRQDHPGPRTERTRESSLPAPGRK